MTQPVESISERSAGASAAEEEGALPRPRKLGKEPSPRPSSESIDWQRDLEITKFRQEREIARLKLREDHILAILATVVEAAEALDAKIPAG